MAKGTCYWCDGETGSRFEEYCSVECREADAARYEAEQRAIQPVQAPGGKCCVCGQRSPGWVYDNGTFGAARHCSEPCRLIDYEKRKKERHCFWCGVSFQGHYAAQYCSEGCKIQAWRAGKRPPRGDTAERKPPLLKLRFSILERDGFRCRYCGRCADEGVVLQIDHVYPASKGGLWAEGNLVTACWECNIGKGDRLLREREGVPVIAEEGRP